jgi:endonuclease-3 related protein
MKARGGSRQRGAHPSQNSDDSSRTVRTIYRELSRAWGPQHWWPAETPFEVIVSAILTQNTSWTNVEQALGNLRTANVLSVAGIRALPLSELEQMIRPSGYFRQKAARLKDFVAVLDQQYGGSLDAMLARPTVQLREELLAQKGIGPETADSILLYAGQHAVFVVDAYTRRVLERHGAIPSDAHDDEVRELVERALQGEEVMLPSAEERSAAAPQVHLPSVMSRASRATLAQAYNEMHGLFVQLGKHYCTKRNPKCETCPVRAFLPAPHVVELPVKSKKARRRRRDRGYNETRPEN